jgi:hypothetical protein
VRRARTENRQTYAKSALIYDLNGCIVLVMFSVEKLGDEIAVLAMHIDAATHRLLECVRQFDEECGWAAQGAVSCAAWLVWRIGLDPATAREKVRVARALGKLPALDGALKAGKLSYAKVRALTRVATPETEAQLLELAMVATGAQLERLCRGYRSALAADNALPPAERSVRRRDLPGGMVKLEIVLLPDEADLVLRALDRAREDGQAEGEGRLAGGAVPGELDAGGPSPASRRDAASPRCAGRGGDLPSRADGVVALAESYLAGNAATGNGGERFQVMVHVDQDPLAPDGVLAGTLDDGTPVSAEALRRVACDCGLVAVRGDGEGLDIGRRARTIPPAIRRALAIRDRGCCFPGCTHDRFLHGHHIRHWLHGGETSVDNLALLCTYHHRLVHEGGWAVARTGDGELAFTAPDGRALPPVPAREPGEDSLVFLREWAEERGVDLGADANLPLWDGTRPDYDWAVGAMLLNLAG